MITSHLRRSKWLPLTVGALASIGLGAVLLGIGRQDATGHDASDGASRWLNVTLVVPASLTAERRPPYAQEQRYLLVIYAADSEDVDDFARLEIDASTGDVIFDSLSAVLPADVNAVIDSVEVSSARPSVWPFVDGSAPAETSSWGSLRFPVPADTSGIIFIPSNNYCDPGTDCAVESLIVFNGFSQLNIDASSGRVNDWSRVLAEDRLAFERYVGALEIDSGTPAPSLTPEPGPSLTVEPSNSPQPSATSDQSFALTPVVPTQIASD